MRGEVKELPAGGEKSEGEMKERERRERRERVHLLCES